MMGYTLQFWRTVARDRSGTSLIEFAVLLPMFLTLVFGMIDVGRLFWAQTALQHAVEMAARCATINATTCGTAANVKTYATTQAYGLTFPTSTFTVTAPTCGNQVTASYAFSFSSFLPVSTMTLAAKSCYPK